jgi:CBS domain-containing protein
MVQKTDCQARRYKMLTAGKLMTKNVITVKKDTLLVDVIRLLAKNNITGIPVVEDDMTLVGIISEQDVLRLFYTYDEEKGRTVNDFMTKPVIHFDVNDPLLDICYCLKDNSIRRVPVTSNGKLVGIVSRSDIIKIILQLWDKIVIPAVGVSVNKER